jgi:transposase InsO family protein
MTSVRAPEHGCVYLNAIIDCLTRGVVSWELSVRCRATEAIAVIQTAVRDQGIGRAELTLGTDNGSALTARRLGWRSPGSASLTVAATATGRAKRSSTYGSAI